MELTALQSLAEVTIGTKFSHYESEFEVQHIHAGHLTYAAVCGGKRFKMPLRDFEERVKSGRIELKNSSLISVLKQDEIRELSRKAKYCEFAINNLVSPTSRKELKAILPVVSRLLNYEKKPHEKTYSIWVKAYINQGYGGIAKPAKRGNYSLRFEPNLEMLITKAIKEVYLVREHRRAKDVQSYIIGTMIDQGALLDSDKPPISLRTIQRRIAQLDQIEVIRIKQGPKAAERAARASGRTHLTTEGVLTVEIDTNYLNLFVIDEDTGEPIGRPLIICMIDVRTKMIIGYHITLFSSNSSTTLCTLINAITTHGVPTKLIGDRGTEFINSSLKTLCDTLVIEFVQPPAETPNSKPHIESFFKYLSYDFANVLPGTTKSSPDDLGDYDPRKDAALTMSDLEQQFIYWRDNIYHKEPHSKSGRVPIVYWQEEKAKFPPMLLSADDADRIARRPVILTVNNGTVRFSELSYRSHALKRFDGKKVKVLINDVDLGKVYVEHPEERGVLIEAKSNEEEYTNGLTLSQHKEALKIRDELTERDMAIVGPYAAIYSRYKLYEKLKADKGKAKNLRKKLLQGKPESSMKKNFYRDDFGGQEMTSTEKTRPTKSKNNNIKTSLPIVDIPTYKTSRSLKQEILDHTTPLSEQSNENNSFIDERPNTLKPTIEIPTYKTQSMEQ